MERIEKYGIFCRSWEGGFSNHPNDSGGATMKGVTLATYRQYCKEKGYKRPTVTDLKNISDKTWNAVLRWGYWGRIKADQINDEWVAYIFVDWIWMSGPRYISFLQRRLGLTADGIIGKKSLAKINSMKGEDLFNLIWNERKAHFERISKGKNAVFLNGWMRRLNSIHYGYLMPNGGKEKDKLK